MLDCSANVIRTSLRKGGQLKDSALRPSVAVQGAGYCHPDLRAIGGRCDSIQTGCGERPPVVEPNLPHCGDTSILVHANDGVVSTIGHAKIRIFFERRVAGPVGIFCLDTCRSEIHWKIQQVRVNTVDASHLEDLAIIHQFQHRNTVSKWLAHVEKSRRRVIQDDTDARADVLLAIIKTCTEERGYCAGRS